jgi:hypothetical protein
MNPLLLGGAAAALVALMAASKMGGTSASQDQMIFKDYQWVTSLPSTMPAVAPGHSLATLVAMAKAGQWPTANPLSAHLPPPPNVSATGGHWQFYPNGYGHAPNGFVYPVFSGVPSNIDIYAWRPSSGWNPANPSVLNVTKVNGYWVTWVPYHVQQVAPGQLRWTSGSGRWPPPPPGEVAGHWSMVKPGFCVWLNTTNANSATQATFGFNLSGAAPAPIPPPAAAPIGVTPPAAHA